MTFYVGQKVVCVEPEPDGWWLWFYRLLHPEPKECPTIGEVYTVINIIPACDGCSLELLELPSPATKYYEAGFCSTGFRPAVITNTDISVFTAMLNQKQREHEFTI